MRLKKVAPRNLKPALTAQYFCAARAGFAFEQDPNDLCYNKEEDEMHISAWIPRGLQLQVASLIEAAINDVKKHPIAVDEKDRASVSVQITTCDFDPVGEMPAIVQRIGERLFAAAEGRIDVVCKAIGIDGATWNSATAFG
ncbi:hypothetical protein HY970_01755 [Candidatus Kaiserbacteria bacterium]|nr:hypothetical protein [Candidatus Kaiserbacteria bacterium]